MIGAAIPEKHFYTIGDVGKLTGIKPHVLRYWESQFKVLRPARRYSGHRKYTRREIDIVARIKQLVVDQRFTLAGARKEIGRVYSGRPEISAQTRKEKQTPSVPILREIKNDIEACLDILSPIDKQELFDLK